MLSHLRCPVGLGTYLTKLMYVKKSDHTRRFLNSFMIVECLCFFSRSNSLSSRSRTLPSSSSLSVVPHSLQHQRQQWTRWGSCCNEACLLCVTRGCDNLYHLTIYHRRQSYRPDIIFGQIIFFKAPLQLSHLLPDLSDAILQLILFAIIHYYTFLLIYI